jgi:hypothetical protein
VHNTTQNLRLRRQRHGQHSCERCACVKIRNEADLLSYRTLLVKSDDVTNSGVDAVRLAQIQ